MTRTLRIARIGACALALQALTACVTSVTSSAGPHAFPDTPRERGDPAPAGAGAGPCQVPPFDPPKAVIDDSSFTGGTVGVELVIQPSGVVSQVGLTQSSGSSTLDKAVVEHLYKVRCRFQPVPASPQVVRQEFTFRR